MKMKKLINLNQYKPWNCEECEHCRKLRDTELEFCEVLAPRFDQELFTCEDFQQREEKKVEIQLSFFDEKY